MAETEYQRVPRAYEEMMSLINALDTPLEGNVFRDISGQLWNLWKKTMIDAGYTDVQVEMAKGRFKDLASRLDASDEHVEDIIADVNAKLGQLGASSTFKGSDTNANILAKTGMQIGDEWYDTTNQQSLRWNGIAWVYVGGVIKIGDHTIGNKKLIDESVSPAKLDGAVISLLSEGAVFDGLKKKISLSDTGYNKYWNASGLQENVYEGQIWHALPLFKVEEGDRVTLYGWGEMTGGIIFVLFKEVGENIVLRSNDLQINPDGSRFYIMPSGVVDVGLNLQHLDGINYPDPEIQFGEFKFNDKFRVALEEHLEEINKSSLDTVDMYEKARSPKSFDKDIGIIVGGQSNAQGTNLLSELPSYIQLPLENISYTSNITGGITRPNLSESDLTNSKWGFDLVTYYYLTQVANKKIHVIKNAVGGTSIDPTGATTMHWTAFYEQLLPTDTSLLLQFEKMIKSTVTAQGENFDIRAMLWHQGEGDRASLSPVAAKNYYSNFKYLIDYCRGIAGDKRLPFIAGTISKSSTEYDEQVDIAIRKINDEDPNFYLVEMKDAKLHDPYHFNSAWSEYFGKCAYDYLIDAKVLDADKLNPSQPT